MLTRQNMKGLFVLLITPMDGRLRVDYDGHRANVRKVIEMGAHGIILNGTNGEFHTTTDEERERLTQILVEEGKGKLMCVAGCSGTSTDEVIRRTRRAAELGADGVMNVLPFYYPPTKPEALRFWREVAAACPDIGIICYNNPGVTQVVMTPDDYAALEDVPNFVGSKIQGADVMNYMNCMRMTTQAHFPMEGLWGVSKVLGGPGVLASFIYACPKYTMKWYKTVSSGDVAESIRMQNEVNRLLHDVVLPPFLAGASDTAGTKAFIEAMGHWHCGKVRSPYADVPQAAIDKMRRQVAEQFPQFLD